MKTRAIIVSLTTAFALLATLGIPPGVAAKASEPKVREFDHATGGSSASFHVTLKEGDDLNVKIKNTAPDCFTYDYEKVELVPQAGSTEKTVEIKDHNPSYGGYIVNVRRSSSDGVCGQRPAVDLEPATIVIVVDTQDIEVAFAGGFTFSDLTNPLFATRTDANDKKIIVQDTGAEDEVDLSVGAFIHVYGKHWSKRTPALTFGLGVGEDSKTTYFLGPFWRLGKQAYIGGGLMASSVDRLPAGVNVGDELTDPNTLSNLGSKTKTGVFLALSYTFLGGKEAFEKPFKPAPSTGAPASVAPQAVSVKECGITSFNPTLSKPSGAVSSAQLTFEGVAGCKPTAAGNKIEISAKDSAGTATDTLTETLDPNGKFSKQSNVVFPVGTFTVTLKLLDAGGAAVAGVPTKQVNFTVQ